MIKKLKTFIVLFVAIISILFCVGCSNNDNKNVEPKQTVEIILPQTLYCCINRTIEINFHNIITVPTNTVLIRTSSNIEGPKHQYKNKWVATPTMAGDFYLTITLFDVFYNELTEKTVDVKIKDMQINQEKNVLVIGDSTVYAGLETQAILEESKHDDKFSINLLGTMNYGEANNRFEGRSGWKATSYTKYLKPEEEKHPFYNVSKNAFDFSYYMNSNGYEKVDVVILQLGINDVFYANPLTLQTEIENYLEAINIMIESIKEYNSNTKIILHPIFPCCQNQDEFGDVYKECSVWEYMRNMFETNKALLNKYLNCENVYVSYFNAALDAVENQPRDVHPTPQGYVQLGKQIYNYIKAIYA